MSGALYAIGFSLSMPCSHICLLCPSVGIFQGPFEGLRSIAVNDPAVDDRSRDPPGGIDLFLAPGCGAVPFDVVGPDGNAPGAEEGQGLLAPGAPAGHVDLDLRFVVGGGIPQMDHAAEIGTSSGPDPERRTPQGGDNDQESQASSHLHSPPSHLRQVSASKKLWLQFQPPKPPHSLFLSRNSAGFFWGNQFFDQA